MIGWLSGPVVYENGERLVINAGGVGYEVLVPPYPLKALHARHLSPEDPQARLTGLENPVSLFIYYHVAERKPAPTLFGFNEPQERDFFSLLSSVSRLGPTTAARSLIVSVPEYAGWIMSRDVRALSRLPGIGTGKAEQIITQLRGRVALFAMMTEEELPAFVENAAEQHLMHARAALQELGYRAAEAEALVRAAQQAHPEATTVEALLDAVWAESRVGVR